MALKKETKNKSGRRISYDLIIALLSTVIISSLLTVCIIYWYLDHNSNIDLTHTSEAYIAHLENSLEDPVWTLNKRTISQVCDPYINTKLVVKLKIIDLFDNTVLYERQTPDEKKLLEVEGVVKHGNKDIAHIQMGFSRSIAGKEIFRTLRPIVILIIVIILVITGVSMIFIKYLLQAPLQILLTGIGKIESGMYDYQFKTLRHVEFRSITDKFEQMVRRIKDREASLRKSEQDLSITLKSIGDGVIATDTTGRVVRMNPVAEKLTGWKLHEAREHQINKIFDIVNSKTRSPVENPVDRVMRDGKIAGLANHTLLLARDGKEYQIADSGAPIIDDDGSIRGVVLTFRDVTEKYHVQEKLRESEIWIRNMFNSLEEAVLVVSPDRVLVDINTAAVKIFGYSKNELLKLSTEILHIDHEHYVEFGRRINESFDREEAAEFEFEAKRKNGEIFPTEHIVSLLKNDKGQSIGIISVVKDITGRKQAEEALKESEERFRTIADCAYNWETWIDLDGEYIHVSPSFERITGYSPDKLLKDHRFIETIIHSDDRKKLIEYTTHHHTGESPVQNLDFRIIHHNGNIRWISHTCQPVYDKDGKWIGRRASNSDITEQKKLEAQLQQSQKMEAIGVLAGGVAHDFNNILSIIIGNAGLALMDAGIDDSLKEVIEEINTAGERGAALTRQLLAFSRKQIIQPEILDLNKLFASLEKMLYRLITEDIEILKNLESALWQVEIDPGQMEQVIMNLTINARDAMPKGGTLTIETTNMAVDENYCHMHGIEKQAGSYVMLAVSDTGKGMDKETQKHIFEPFYTTKERGKGTGLGLSTVYGIVKQNNGFVWVYSEPGKGSTFKIYLPRAERDVASEEKEQTPVIERGGSETILIVEDDDALRELTGTILKRNGYKVLEAENGEDALRKSREHEGVIELLLTDVIMPRMGGKETAERLQPLRPQMKIIYMSGYTDNAIVHHGVLAAGLNFLQKPFSSKDLVHKVGEVLDSA